MSEYLRSFNSDDQDAPEPEQSLAPESPESDPASLLEYDQTLQDATRVQQFLNAQIYLNEDRLLESTHSVVRLLNQAAKSNDLIGQPAAIIVSNPAESSDAADDYAIYEGNFLGFVVQADEVPNPYDNGTTGGFAYQPRLHFQIEEAASQANPKFCSGDVSRSSLVFNDSWKQPVAIEAKRWSTPMEKVAIEHFGLFNQELAKPLSASSIQKAAAIGFYLLNKSTYAGATWFEDKLIDSSSFHLAVNSSYDIEVDFYLEASQIDGQLEYDFIRTDNQAIKLKQLAVQTISCLPRSYIRSSKYTGQEISLNRQQKSLYFSFMDEDKTYHIPFEAVRTIKASGGVDDYNQT